MENFLNTISTSVLYSDLYKFLKSLKDDDCYLQEYLDTNHNYLNDEFLYTMDMYDIIFIASDDRILLTQKGEAILQYLSQVVEIEKEER